MTLRKVFPLVALTAITLILLAFHPSGAADDNHVAMVVDYGNGEIVTRCVGFAEEAITGYEALERSGLPVETDFQTGGAAVCRINGQGCPSNDCFCSCRGGGDCIYWSYWHLNDNVWNYSAAGSGLYQVANGAVEGWVWGLGAITQASPPPVIPFDDICINAQAGTSTPTATPTRTATPVILPTPVATNETAVVPPTIALVSSATPVTPVPSGESLPTPAATASTLPSIRPPAVPAATPTSPLETPIVQANGAETGINSIPPASGPPSLTPTIELTNEPQAPSETLSIIPLGTTSSTAAEPAGEVIASLAVESTQASLAGAPSTPVLFAIVGADAAPAGQTGADAADISEAAVTVDWFAIAGFAGLVLLLAGLALFVFWRRNSGNNGEGG